MNAREIVKLSLTAIDSKVVDKACLEVLLSSVGIDRIAKLITIYPDKAKLQYGEIPEDYALLIEETKKEIRRILSTQA